MLMNGAVGSSNAYITRSITSPAHPWMALWGQTSSFWAVTLCLRSARILAKSGRGANEGGFFNNTAACENILHGYLYVFDLAFVILKGIYGFKFPKKFLEISSRDLTSFLLQLI